MFTGIVETIAQLKSLVQDNGQLHLTVASDLAQELSIDQSVAHDGICLTVTHIEGNTYTVTAIDETIQKTTIGQWTSGKKINLERAMLLGARLDGHMVQGHVDGVGNCVTIEEEKGSRLITISFDETFAAYMIEKGSICINGTSLTCFNVGKNSFQVAIIPYTWEHTNFHALAAGDQVNLEFDVVGKYFARWMDLKQA